MALDQGEDGMTKPTGLSAFKRKTEEKPLAASGQASERRRGKKETVSLAVRVTRGQWERLHHLAIAEGVSLQHLCLKGLNYVFKEQGLPELH